MNENSKWTALLTRVGKSIDGFISVQLSFLAKFAQQHRVLKSIVRRADCTLENEALITITAEYKNGEIQPFYPLQMQNLQ